MFECPEKMGEYLFMSEWKINVEKWLSGWKKKVEEWVSAHRTCDRALTSSYAWHEDEKSSMMLLFLSCAHKHENDSIIIVTWSINI